MMRIVLPVLCLAALLWVGPAAAVSVELSPAFPTATTVGSPVTVDVFVSDLGDFDAPALGAFDIDVEFDPAILSFTSASFGALLGDESLGEALTSAAPSPGGVNLFEVSLLPAADLVALQPGAFALVSLTFDVVAAGPTGLALSIEALADEFGNPLRTAAVPTPASLVLMAAGAVGLLSWSRGPRLRAAATRRASPSPTRRASAAGGDRPDRSSP